MLVSAILSICLVSAPTACETHKLKIEPRACHLPAYRAAIQLNNVDVAATAMLVCEKGN